MTTLTSPSNPKLKLIRSLRTQRKQRDESGLYVVEGIRHVGEALQSGAQVAYLCYAPERLESEFGRQLVAEQERRGLPCYAVAAEVFESLADKDNPQGLLAVVHQPRHTLADLNTVNFRWGVALVAPQDPGNIGTILRTVDAVGASGLLLLDDSADAYAPSAVRASMGAVFRYPIARARFGEFATWARQAGYHIYGSSARGSRDYREMESYPAPRILLLGSERQGLSAEQVEVCEVLLRLPMKGSASSLNLAVAAGVLLYAMLA